jgi:hypothetical protein
MSAGDISAAVTEAQAVLTLVRRQLRTGLDIPAERVFTLHAAVSLAIQRLDAVHDALHAQEDVIVTGVPTAVEVQP